MAVTASHENLASHAFATSNLFLQAGCFGNEVAFHVAFARVLKEGLGTKLVLHGTTCGNRFRDDLFFRPQ